MGAPATAFSSASVTLAGNIVISGGAAGGGTFLAGGALLFGGLLVVTVAGVRCGSSLELQLEIPKAASSESTRTVKATRVGVHKDFSVLIFLLACISYLLPEHFLTRSIPFATNFRATAALGRLRKPEGFEDDWRLSLLAYIRDAG